MKCCDALKHMVINTHVTFVGQRKSYGHAYPQNDIILEIYDDEHKGLSHTGETCHKILGDFTVFSEATRCQVREIESSITLLSFRNNIL